MARKWHPIPALLASVLTVGAYAQDPANYFQPTGHPEGMGSVLEPLLPPVILGNGPRPGAGATLMAPAFSPLPAGIVGLEIADDPVRGYLWVVCEGTATAPGFIFQIDKVTMGLAGGTTPLVTNELDAGVGSPPGPDIDGLADGVAVLPSGNLLVADFNGDVLRFDDTLFEIDPMTGGATATLANFWYLDSATPGCGGCRPNTNTNVPLERIEQALGVDTSDSGIGGPGPIFIGAMQGFFGISHVTLTPGLPGTWNLVRRYATDGRIGSFTGLRSGPGDGQRPSERVLDHRRHRSRGGL